MRTRQLVRRTVATAAVAALAAGGSALVAPSSVAAIGPRVTNGCVTSVPDPGTTEPVRICYTLFQPAAARQRKVPMVLHSHGWGGSRTTDPAAFRKWLDAGFGILSFDQRGFGESGGTAQVMNPAHEGRDVQALVRLVSGLRWVRQDGPGDPRLGAIGGSYGGGYQYAGAFRHLMTRGKPVFDALAPEITWYDLKESLGPSDVARTSWISVLTAASLPSQALPPEILVAAGQGVATGMWPDGSVPGTPDLDRFFLRNGPKWHVGQGRRLGIPVLMGQGATDTLFPLDQGLRTWQHALTRRAKARSIFVGYNGGHVLPAVVPQAIGDAGDPCSRKLAGGSFADLALRFMTEQLKGRDTGLRGYGRFHLATATLGCTTVSSVAADRTLPVGTVASPSALGAPIAVPVAEGPIRIAGTQFLTGTMTALGIDSRAFYGLAVGTSPLDARLVQNNVMPFRSLEPVVGEKRTIRLPAVAVDVPAGQTLYVMVTAVSDTFAAMGSRVPGAVLLQDAAVRLPVVG